ncbi:MAG: hypothetical protein NT062_25185 [Proteobacteria bacterium]|nr:hypothetical protein [Pseudomonadota bacterium]
MPRGDRTRGACGTRAVHWLPTAASSTSPVVVSSRSVAPLVTSARTTCAAPSTGCPA